jgi:hypothetical protein
MTLNAKSTGILLSLQTKIKREKVKDIVAQKHVVVANSLAAISGPLFYQ